jgi:uncharacterized membrane protein YphA (DoxX/SURF4 family)
MSFLDRLGRIAVAAPFVWLGAEAAADPGIRVKLAVDLGIPEAVADKAVRFNGAAMVAGGLGVATGILPRAAALGLVGSMVPTTLAGHAFWKDTDPMARKTNRIHLLKNVGLTGAALVVAAAAARRSADPAEG